MYTPVHNMPEIKCNSDITRTACSGLPQCDEASLVVTITLTTVQGSSTLTITNGGVSVIHRLS